LAWLFNRNERNEKRRAKGLHTESLQETTKDTPTAFQI